MKFIKTALFALILAIAMLNLVACSNSDAQSGVVAEPNLFIVNDSEAEIASYRIYSDEFEISIAGHPSTLPLWERGEIIRATIDEAQNCFFQVDIVNKAGTVIAHGEFTKNFSNRATDKKYLYILDSENGTTYITDSEPETPPSSNAPSSEPDNGIKSIIPLNNHGPASAGLFSW